MSTTLNIHNVTAVTVRDVLRYDDVEASRRCVEIETADGGRFELNLYSAGSEQLELVSEADRLERQATAYQRSEGLPV